MKLTPWFPGAIKPVRPGVYQQKSGGGHMVGYQRWDGMRWFLWIEDPDGAANQTFSAADGRQNDDWRGLAEQPGGSK